MYKQEREKKGREEREGVSEEGKTLALYAPHMPVTKGCTSF